MIRNLQGKSKKIIISGLLAVLTLGALAGCSSKEIKNPAVKEIGASIEKASDISNMKLGDSDKLKKLYDIGSDEVEEFTLYTAPTNIKADEIAVIKAKDSNNVNSIKDKIAKRAEEQGNAFKEYLPEEYSLIEKKVLKTKGNYVLFVVSKDTVAIEEAFDKAFK